MTGHCKPKRHFPLMKRVEGAKCPDFSFHCRVQYPAKARTRYTMFGTLEMSERDIKGLKSREMLSFVIKTGKKVVEGMSDSGEGKKKVVFLY